MSSGITQSVSRHAYVDPDTGHQTPYWAVTLRWTKAGKPFGDYVAFSDAPTDNEVEAAVVQLKMRHGLE